MIDSILDKLTDALTIPSSWVKPLIAIQYGCGSNKPDFTNLNVWLGKKNTTSLYYNGIFYFRFMLPFYIGIMVRWSGSETKKAFLQTHIGWRLNGVPAITFRIQSDPSGFLSNKGSEFNNHGQAISWSCGTK